MAKKYNEYKQLNLPNIGEEILQKWKETEAFEKSISLREGAKPFVFFEGPPSANGLPGIHHVISRTLKDLVCRYKTMQGFQVKRKGGWDTHGLPVELGVEKELGITKEDIGKKISVEEYNQKCREAVLRFKDKWDDITQKSGYWVDLQEPYITFDNKYIESLWWCLKSLYKKQYLYESVSIQPFSPAAGTGLSSHELNQPGTYKDVKDTSATVMFKIRELGDSYQEVLDMPAGPDVSTSEIFTLGGKNKYGDTLINVAKENWNTSEGEFPGVFFMAWTTTPWTLPSNLGLTVGANINYVLIKTFNPYTYQPTNIILAKDLIRKYLKEDGKDGDFAAYKESDKVIPWKIIKEFTGEYIEGVPYEQLLPTEANKLEKIREITPNAHPFRVVLDSFRNEKGFVTTEDGTGIVHTAPAFGADDFKVGKANNLGILTLVDKEGKFVDGVGEFSGRYVKNYKDEKDYVDVNVDIAVKLKLESRAFKVEKYEHSYPHCWRTDKPIIYYPLDAWFIKTTAVKDKMVELNKTINWKPASTGTGRFGNWLENMVDWNLSRSRFWGTPLPIWKTEDGEEEVCIGSIEELNNEIKKAAEVLGGETNKHYLHNGILDLHKPYVDDITLVSASGKPMKRVPDLIDVWFDSGAMPYAQWHFPFENKEVFANNYPADFIAEGVDQTRGWFYTLHALAALLNESIKEELGSNANIGDGIAYKTVVSNGLVLDKNGNKMSKRLGNVVDPFKTIDTYGADATRWYLITNASPWDSLKFDEAGIQEVQRKFFGTLYNTYQFFALYANVDGFEYGENIIPVSDRPELDQWIISCLNSLVQKVTENLDAYEPTQAGRLVEEFVDANLSNWFVRLSRRRFWKPAEKNTDGVPTTAEVDKLSAYQTLFECLETVSKLMAPIAPFFADWLFNNLHANTELVQSVHHAHFPTSNPAHINLLLENRMELAQNTCSLILSLRKKVNIKVRQPLQKVFIPAKDDAFIANVGHVAEIIKAETNIKEIEFLAADNDFIKKKAKANFKTLGKRLGQKMKWVAGQVEGFNNDTIDKILIESHTLIYTEPAKDNEEIVLNAEDIEVITDEIPGFEIASSGTLTVALDVTITDALQKEGNAREFINKLQNIRKESGFELTDRINVFVQENEALKPTIVEFKAYICAEILADTIDFEAVVKEGTQIEVNEATVFVKVIKK
jgi:isoleucyl-tRNA synthetase